MSPWVWFVAGIVLGFALAILAVFGFLCLMVQWKHDEEHWWRD